MSVAEPDESSTAEEVLLEACKRLGYPPVPITGLPATFPIRGHLSNGRVHYLASLASPERCRVLAHELAHLWFPNDEPMAEIAAFEVLEAMAVYTEEWFPAHMQREGWREMASRREALDPGMRRTVTDTARQILGMPNS